MSRALLQQALDALRRVGEYGDIYRYKNTEQSPYTQIYEAIDALNVELAKPNQFYPDWDMIKPYHDRIAELEQQLAKPELKPVAWLYRGHLHEVDPSDWATEPVCPLYTAPPKREWVGLTDDEINKIANSPQPVDETSSGYVLPFAHAIESKLKELNT